MMIDLLFGVSIGMILGYLIKALIDSVKDDKLCEIRRLRANLLYYGISLRRWDMVDKFNRKLKEVV